MSQPPNPYRALPKVDALANAQALADLGAPSTVRMAVARAVVDTAREAIALGSPMSPDDLMEATRRGIREQLTPTLRPVINATGIVVHTNLGRAPLDPAAIADVLGYSTLEYDLQRGSRGSRRTHAAELLGELAGSEAALVVNNNAAAVVLMLAATSRGGEVIISRGELIEIGGSFRVPEIMEASGAKLVEVGTTNKTYARDYQTAITPETRAILKVHPSNYRVTGFTHAPKTADLAAVCRRHDVPLLYDAGAATFGPLPDALRDVDVRAELTAGVDVLSFSGDKILGGPQAGLLVGTADFIDRCARHPLARAFRADKMTLGALQYTLRAYLHGEAAKIPVSAMVNATKAALQLRAAALRDRIRGALSTSATGGTEVGVEAARDMVGGGSHPGITMDGAAVTIRLASASGNTMNRLAAALRETHRPVIGVVHDEALWLHVRTIRPDEASAVAETVASAIEAVIGRPPRE